MLFLAEQITGMSLKAIKSSSKVVIFFALTEAPLPDPTPTPSNTPKRTLNGPEIETPNGPKWTEKDQNQALWGGTAGGFVGLGGGVRVVREKENHYSKVLKVIRPALSRINSVIVSARTALSLLLLSAGRLAVIIASIATWWLEGCLSAHT